MMRRSQLLSERRERLSQIPYDFATFLESRPQGYLLSTRLLPHSKDEIIIAILFSIANAKSTSEIDLLSAILIFLKDFQDIGEYDYLDPPNPTDYDTDADVGFQELVQAGRRYRALSEPYKDHSSNDMELFARWTRMAIAANENFWPPHKRWWEKFKSLGSGRKIPAEWVYFPSDLLRTLPMK